MAEDRKTPEHILEETEKDITASSHERAELFRRAARSYSELGDSASAEVMQSLQLAFGAVSAVELERFSGGKPRFIPMIYFEETPPPLSDVLTPERCQHLREFRERTRNPAISAHLSDLLWEVERDHAAARDAADAYLEHAAACAAERDDGAFLTVADALLRSLEISIQIRDADRSKLALERILGAIRTTIASNRPRSAFELVRELLACKKIRIQLPLAEIRELIERAIQQLEGDPLQQRHWERLWLGIVEQLGHISEDLDLVREARIRIGKSHEQTGDFWVEHGSHLPAIPSYQCAIAAYKSAGKCPEKVEASLRKLEQATKASHAEMKEVKVSATISGEVMEQWRAEVVSIYKDMGLGVLADPHYALPDVATIRAHAAEMQRQHSMLSLWPAAVIQEDRIVRTAESPAAHLASEIVQDLLHDLFFKLGHFTAWVFAAVREEGITVREKVMALVSQSPVVVEQRHELINRGLQRYEAEDYISSIHILVFQVEGILRDLARLLGLPANKMDRNGVTQARLLSDLLYDEHLARVLGESLTESLKALLVEQSGPNIRNVIAHGMAASEGFTEQIASILIALLLQVSAFRPAESDTPEETPPDTPEGEYRGPQAEPRE